MTDEQTTDINEVVGAILNKDVPIIHRRPLLISALTHEEAGMQISEILFEKLASVSADEQMETALEAVRELKAALENGPLTNGMFLEKTSGTGSLKRAKVLSQNGSCAYAVVPDEELFDKLQIGELVLLDAGGTAVLGIDDTWTCTGEEAIYERQIDESRIEVTVSGRDKMVVWMASRLLYLIKNEKLVSGSKVLVDVRRGMAIEPLLEDDGVSNYWFIDKRAVPKVSVDDDIGNAPPYIDELVEHVRTEMLNPELGRRYNLRRAKTKLLTGVSGTGKTFSVYGLWRSMYEVMSEITGTPIEELPCRVLWLRMSDIVTKWYGETEQRLSRFFDEVEQLADEEFVGNNNKRIQLPVLAIFEEIDALARTRGTGDSITERVQTTALERLDTNSSQLRDRLVIFVCTTNVPDMVDPAFLRRAGGTTEKFGRLSRESFSAVLGKQIRHMPFSESYGGQGKAIRQVLKDVSQWLFDDSNQPQVEIVYANRNDSAFGYSRDLLTAALCDRAVQAAATAACHDERKGIGSPGLTTKKLITAFDRQLKSVVGQLSAGNVTQYMTLPDGVRIAAVRRLYGLMPKS